MRIGKYCNDLKTTQWDSIRPLWCKPFGLDSGSSFRALHIVNNSTSNDDDNDENDDYEESNDAFDSSSMTGTTSDSHDNNDGELSSITSGDDEESAKERRRQRRRRGYLNPDWVYYIGIEIKPGKGLLKDTTFVYFSTRYYLVNKTSHDLLISQYHFVKSAREKRFGLSWRSSHNFKSEYNARLARAESGTEKRHNISGSGETKSEHANKIVLIKDSMRQFHWAR